MAERGKTKAKLKIELNGAIEELQRAHGQSPERFTQLHASCRVTSRKAGYKINPNAFTTMEDEWEGTNDMDELYCPTHKVSSSPFINS